MASEDASAGTTELEDEVAAMGLEPKPEAEVNGNAEVSICKDAGSVVLAKQA